MSHRSFVSNKNTFSWIISCCSWNISCDMCVLVWNSWRRVAGRLLKEYWLGYRKDPADCFFPSSDPEVPADLDRGDPCVVVYQNFWILLNKSSILLFFSLLVWKQQNATAGKCFSERSSNSVCLLMTHMSQDLMHVGDRGHSAMLMSNTDVQSHVSGGETDAKVQNCPVTPC